MTRPQCIEYEKSASSFYSKHTSSIEVFANENYLNELQYTEFKRTIKNFVKEFEEN